VADHVVINSSPLIFFSRSKHLAILKRFADHVFVAQAVAEEILRRGASDPTAALIRTTSWLEVVPVERIPEEIVQWGLGPGESAVLSLALTQGCEAVVDDLAGRRCAASLGILVRGTLGIVLAAKRHGWIPSARVVMEDMLAAGLYLSRRVLDTALERVGE
jgi:predicted nucleic acid-binding protein